MAESTNESVVTTTAVTTEATTANGMSSDSQIIQENFTNNNQKYLMSAALITDAKDGLVLLSQSTDFINVKLYFLYRQPFLQYLLYVTIFLHHLLILFEKTSATHDNHLLINCLELLCLLIYALRLSHLHLFTPRPVFWSDMKNIIIVVTVLMTFCDIIISLSVNNYIRWTPVLRPLFIINFAENKQIRRSFRNMRNTLPDVLNVLILFFLSILTFAIIGLKLFEKQSIYNAYKEKYFSDFVEILYNLYILVTTSNNPDIMLPAYRKNRWFALYFIIFIVINLYLFMNIILAVIYNNYKKHLKCEVQNVLILKKNNIMRAFNLLSKKTNISTQITGKQQTEAIVGITREVFNDLMQIILDVMDTSKTNRATLISLYWSLMETDQVITRENFCQILDILNFEITIISKTENSTIFEKFIKDLYDSKLSILLRISVKTKYFRNFFDSLILFNTVIIALNVDYKSLEWLLLLLFTIEILAKIYTFGFKLFIHKFWNLFDFIVIGTALILFIVIELKNQNNLKNQQLDHYLDLLLILRVLRLYKIITTINRFKIVVKTILAIIPSIFTYISLLFVIYYSYAIIGMRLLSLQSMTNNPKINCNQLNETSNASNYCLINFNTFPDAMLFLFNLMVVNQWHVLAKTQELLLGTKFIRIYFISFHLICVIVVLNIFTAFVLEAFILEYIDVTDKKLKKSNYVLKLEQLGVNCLQKREEPMVNSHYTNFNDILDADHDLIDATAVATGQRTTQQDINQYCHSLNYSDLRIIIKEKKSVELLLIKMFQNDINIDI